MMNCCKNCGTVLDSDSLICPNCNVVILNEFNEVNDSSNDSTSEEKDYLYLLIFIFFVFMIGCVLYGWFARSLVSFVIGAIFFICGLLTSLYARFTHTGKHKILKDIINIIVIVLVVLGSFSLLIMTIIYCFVDYITALP